MKKTLILFVVFVISLFSITGSIFANEITVKKYSFTDKNGEYLIREVAVDIVKVPKLPEDISQKDALTIWNGEKDSIAKEKCDSSYLSFFNGIKTKTVCKKTVTKRKSADSLELSVDTKIYPKDSGFWFRFWPIFHIIGIFALALIFMARRAPITFMLQNAFIQVLALVFLGVICTYIPSCPFTLPIEIVLGAAIWVILFLCVYTRGVDIGDT